MVEDIRCRRTVTINLRDGLHLRPAAQIVETVRRFGCSVRITKGEITADAGNVLDLIPLKAEFGDTLLLEASGEKRPRPWTSWSACSTRTSTLPSPTPVDAGPTMLIKRGIPVSPGVVSGPALVLGADDFRIPAALRRRWTPSKPRSPAFSRPSRPSATRSPRTSNWRRAISGKQYGAIFAAHLQLVQDPKITEEIVKLIRERHFSPEFASSRVLRRYAKMFQNLGNIYLADRADDIFDLEKRILRHLLGERREELRQLTAPVRDSGPQSHAGRNRHASQGLRAGICDRSRRAHQSHGDSRRRPRNPRRRRGRAISCRTSPAGKWS